MDLKLQLYRYKEKIKRRIHRLKHGSCTVLLYHRIIDLKYNPQGLCVSPSVFKEQLVQLKKTHVFITISEFYEILNLKKSFPKNALLITFDDGYADNYYNALPILEELKLQAIFFISTENINTENLFWWDELDLFFDKVYLNTTLVDELLSKYQLKTVEQLYDFYLIKCKEASGLIVREGLMNELRSLIMIEPEWKKNYRFLKIQELKKMSLSSSVVIGAHTVNHLSLGHIPFEVQKNEIIDSIKLLEEELKIKIEHFSFPYGEKQNFNNDTISICKNLGLKSAAANYCDFVNNKTDMYSYPRFVVRNEHSSVLLTKLKEIV